MSDIKKVTMMRWAFIGLYGIFSLYVMLNYMQSSILRERYIPTKYEGMINGEGHKPYVTRALVPLMTRVAMGLMPMFTEEDAPQEDAQEITEPRASLQMLPWLNRVFPKNHSAYPRAVTLCIVYGFLLGYVVAMRKLSEQLFPDIEAMRWFMPLIGLGVVPAFSWPFQYIYDFSTLALSTACFYCIYTRNFRWYLLWFLLATLNKETSIFILFFFALWFHAKLPAPQYRFWLCMQGLMYALTKAALMVAYSDNPGGFMESHMGAVLNKDLFLNANSFRILGMAGIFFLLSHGWQQKPAFAKTALWFIPVYAVLYILFGNPGEYRICFDMLPLFTLLAGHTLICGTGIADAAIFRLSTEKDHA